MKNVDIRWDDENMNIAIITKYYNNHNYGGLLQAYALQHILDKKTSKGLVRQLSYDFSQEYNVLETENISSLNFSCGVKSKIKDIIKNTKQGIIETRVNKRIDIYKKFEEIIPHTQKIYNNNNILGVIEELDCVIAGSDQIWNPKWFNAPFYLDFVPDDKLKIAYASSMGINEISDEIAAKIIPLINRFDYVSVREESAKDLINKYTDKEVTVVSDPVFLLGREDWNKIAISPLVKENYVYTYLLGARRENRDIAINIANAMNLSLVTVPYIHLLYNDYDKNFGDIQLNEIGPAEFVGLVRDSKIVVTDSFHAVVFSLIYNKKFVALKRFLDTEIDSMNSRITDLLGAVGLLDRIVEDIEMVTPEFCEKEIDFSYANKVIQEKKIISMDFLAKAISGIE